MAMDVPETGLRRLRAGFVRIGSGDLFLRAINRATKGLLKEEFATGVGPNGPWDPTKRGKQALQSRKLPQAFKSNVARGELSFVARTTRDMLTAHQEGRAWPARHSAGGQILTFNKRGRIIKAKNAISRGSLKKHGELRLKRGVSFAEVQAHRVGQRVLPAREIVPTGTKLPESWEFVLDAVALVEVQRWYEGLE